MAAGGSAGIKAGYAPDVAVVATADGRAVPAAGVFTSNLAAAAPVQVSRAHLAATGGRAAGVILTSGNANAATGARGRAAAERLCVAVAGDIGCRGRRDPGVPDRSHRHPVPDRARSSRRSAPIVDGARRQGRWPATQAARAIMTTDTVPKEVVVTGDGFTVGGMAKGAAMLAPNMATMLAVCTTDAAVDAPTLQKALRRSGRRVVQHDHGRRVHLDQRHRARAGQRARCEPLAGRAHDGAHRGVPVAGRADGGRRRGGDQGGARARARARRATRPRTSRPARWPTPCSSSARSSARTPTGAASSRELGSAGVPFDIDRVSVAYGGIVVCAGGVAAPHDGRRWRPTWPGGTSRSTATWGSARARRWSSGTDLGYGYIDENRTTS